MRVNVTSVEANRTTIYAKSKTSISIFIPMEPGAERSPTWS